MTAAAPNLKLLDELNIAYGGHRDRQDGMCAMEAAAYIAARLSLVAK